MNTKSPFRTRARVPASLGMIALIAALGWCGHFVLGQSESLDIEQVAERDLYAMLELHAGATDADVKAAYRTLARKWHPDKNPEDTRAAQRKFAEIAEAYEILSDGTTRQLYDHARRVHAAHDSSSTGSGTEGDDWTATTTEGDWWYYDDDGGAELFGSSFSSGGVFDFGGRTDLGRGGGGSSGIGVGEEGAGSTGAEMRGNVFEFRASDPIELFEALFGGIGLEESDADPWRQTDHFQWQQQQQHFWSGGVGSGGGTSWVGQDYEQYHDYEDGGVMYRRVITTVVFSDGTAHSTAQDYAYDKHSDRWVVSGRPFDYRGPGVAPAGPAGRSRGGCGDEAVDNVLRMNEFLRVGHGIFSVDREFTAVLESDCNFVVLRTRGLGKKGAKVWETGSFYAEGECYASIQDNGMFVIMAGTDPTVPGNVLWSNNQGHVGWFEQHSFHAAVMPNGNLVISQGKSPMHPEARMCVWGAFGCPGDGGVMEWKQVWMSFRSKAGIIWCKVMGCDWEGAADSSSNGGYESDHDHYYRYNRRRQHDGNTEGSGESSSSSSSSKWRFGTRGGNDGDGDTGGGGFRWRDGEDWLAMSAAALRSAVDRGVAALKETLAKIKAAAEETAYAASRPRHW